MDGLDPYLLQFWNDQECNGYRPSTRIEDKGTQTGVTGEERAILVI